MNVDILLWLLLGSKPQGNPETGGSYKEPQVQVGFLEQGGLTKVLEGEKDIIGREGTDKPCRQREQRFKTTLVFEDMWHWAGCSFLALSKVTVS